MSWGAIISLRKSFEIFDEFDRLQPLLRISTKREILEILLTDILAPRELNPVIEHLEHAFVNSSIILDELDFNELECQLDALAYMVDVDIARQTGEILGTKDYRLLKWISEYEVIIGEFDSLGR